MALDKNELFRQNAEILLLLNSKTDAEFTNADKIKLAKYAGIGGARANVIEFLEDNATGEITEIPKSANIERGILDEYYTPTPLVELMWQLCIKHNFKGGRVLEPSCGVGVFLTNAPVLKNPIIFDACEINPTTARIARILHPSATIYNQGFEEGFIKNNKNIQDSELLPSYDLVIGNPPYGAPNSYFMGLGESKKSGRDWIYYFINRGLDALKPKGLLCFVIGNAVGEGFLGGKFANGHPNTYIKLEIDEKAKLLQAIKIPSGAFAPQAPTVKADILLFQKNE